MIEMEMANNDGFDVLDIVSGGFDGVWEPVVVGVFNSWKDIRDRCRPLLYFV
jgi:hypothetical protein